MPDIEMTEYKFPDEEQVQDQTLELDDELEIEIVDDTPEEDRKNATPLPKEIVDEIQRRSSSIKTTSQGFGDATTNMLFYKIDDECWDTLITFLVYLDRMPETIPEYGIILSEFILDETIIATLRKI